MNSLRTGPRVRAPELSAGDWFNTPQPLTLAGLRGRFVLLDFWTSCCGNCLHVLDELRPLEAKHADVLTVIGVHSPKFPHEAEPAAVEAAIARSDVRHPVLNDPDLALWRQYAVRAWPTLVLIDPDGYVVAQAAGEGQVSALDMLIEQLAPRYPAVINREQMSPDDRYSLLITGERTVERTGEGTHEGTHEATEEGPDGSAEGALRFPAKAVSLGDRILVADAGHHQLVELAADGETVLRRIGSGARGAPFAEPNGLTVLPPGLAAYDVLVADTANHALQGVRLADGAVTRVELPTAQLATVTGPVPAVLSPWDVAWWPAIGKVVVAAAGVHLLLTFDPASGAVDILAGTTVEGLRDGPAEAAWLAQPSGLAVDGDVLWFVDAESSALRKITAAGEVRTAVGAGLFDFGHVDGPASQARFQHPLGVTLLGDGSLAVLDTYNGAVRQYDPATDTVRTLADGLAEPSGGFLQDGELVVVESAAHRLVRPIPRTAVVSGEPLQVVRPTTQLGSDVLLRVDFTPPPGRKLDDRYGPATRLSVTASPPELLPVGAGDGAELTRSLRLSTGVGVLHVTAQAASCDEGGEHPACYLARQDWGVPVEVHADGDPELTLILLG